MSTPYKRYLIYRAPAGTQMHFLAQYPQVGSVDAQDGREAIFRLCGGEYGRRDFSAIVAADQRGYT